MKKFRIKTEEEIIEIFKDKNWREVIPYGWNSKMDRVLGKVFSLDYNKIEFLNQNQYITIAFEETGNLTYTYIKDLIDNINFPSYKPKKIRRKL